MVTTLTRTAACGGDDPTMPVIRISMFDTFRVPAKQPLAVALPRLAYRFELRRKE